MIAAVGSLFCRRTPNCASRKWRWKKKYILLAEAQPNWLICWPLLLADSYVTPTLADAVSTWGTKQFTDWVTNHVRSDLPERNFVVVTRFRNTRYARDAESELKNVYLKDRVFGPTIPESVQALTAIERADIESYDTMRGKYGNLRGDVKRLAESFAGFLAKRSGTPSPVFLRS